MDELILLDLQLHDDYVLCYIDSNDYVLCYIDSDDYVLCYGVLD